MKIYPSLISADILNLESVLTQFNPLCDGYHIDIMDGHFVPNLSFGPDIVGLFKRLSHLFLDVHIMVDNPEYFADIFIKAGADQITFHYEALPSNQRIHELITRIHQKGVKAGISLRPETGVNVLDPFINELDIVLLMSVNPGFGGQPFLMESIERCKQVKALINLKQAKCLLEIDGGINDKTARLVSDSVDVLVAGSYIFKQDIKQAVASLCVK
ncbi:MAG: ribulose-phosphate 3-epimerase [Erysipelotrichaceae bacterium]